MAAPCAACVAEDGDGPEILQNSVEASENECKRPQFGTRFLKDPRQVFQHNAWDNVEWTEEQEVAARKKVLENSQPLPLEKQEEFDSRANEYWNDFYKIHENRFFKDRHWLFTEFPELAPNCRQYPSSQTGDAAEQGPNYVQHLSSQTGGADKGTRGTSSGVATPAQTDASPVANGDFPGSSSSYRILEVGCGVGNTVFPILKTNNDPGLFVYCCDFSSTAVDLVKSNAEYDPARCFAFVHDLSEETAPFPVPPGSLDVIVLIFVLSALHPDKMQASIRRLAELLKPGGVLLLRDYGRYDMAQLRFKKGRCLSENFYVRGDGTRVFFFTQDELHDMFTLAGLEKVQNLVDRRLQVNRGKQLTMYRVWIQCKYRKA
ncbi:tRNA N(3)-methylcytidine methyltransferase METTL2 [Anguilla anguilla]|uniref:tRNA N(3)-methylcytidine methyltransferase METTL2 n=1 Tax=Anguilla anguilla TaxID=7936 RepID=UPI0015ADF0D9|nr:tRNA N(3)-methylcytidine methyltransferase METTL2 [Anguilla anguilla]